MLSRCREEYREGEIVVDKRQKITNAKKDTKELSKLKKLEKENAQLKKELDLLKKWQRFLAEEHQSGIDSSRDSEHCRNKIFVCLVGWFSKWLS